MSRLYFIMVLFLILNIIHIFSCLPCDAIDRKYSCNCILEPNNRTVMFENEEQYNASSDNFLPAMKSLQYCQGSYFCRPDFNLIPASEVIKTKNYLVCFNDNSCLSDGLVEVSTVRGFTNACKTTSCMHLTDLIQFNITNDVLQTSPYTCYKVGQQGLKVPYCIKPICKSFVAVEKLCVCQKHNRHCTCSSYCEHLLTTTSHKTYALFLTFGEIFITEGIKASYFHWIVLTILTIGLTFLLLTFCKLCEKAMNPSTCGNQAENTEAIRRILTNTLDSNGPSTSTTAKNSLTTAERGEQGSPPPTYEQVLKEKCIEFKRSIA